MRNLLYANLRQQGVSDRPAGGAGLYRPGGPVLLGPLRHRGSVHAGVYPDRRVCPIEHLPIPTLILAPLLSLHLGADYGNNTLRNKLIVGHTRTEVYLADLLACVVTSVALDAVYLALSSALCVKPILEISGRLLRFSPGQVFLWVAVLLARAAWAAVVKLVVTLLGNRTAASIVVLLLVVAAALVSTTGIDEVSYLSRNLMVDGNAGRMTGWQLALDLLPTGQYYQVSRLDTPNLWRMPLLSLAVIAASTGAGLAFFRRKYLK